MKKIRKALNFIPLFSKANIAFAFPVLYKLCEIHPTSATILVTNRCNLKCVMCRQWKEPALKELAMEEWRAIFDDLWKSGIRNIHFSGGEPLIRADLAELIKHCAEKGFTVGLTTNGLLLNKEKLAEIISAGCASIVVSVDATGEEYENIRGVKGVFAKVENALKLIAETRKTSPLDSCINFTLMKNNIGALPKVKKLADTVEIPLTVCLLDWKSSIFNLEDNREKLWIKDEKDFKELDELLERQRFEKIRNPKSLIMNFAAFDYVRRYFNDPLRKDVPCVSSQDRIIVDPYGNMLGGCLSMGSFGNLKDESFEKISSQDRYVKAKKGMFYKKCPGCSCGYYFNLKFYMPTAIQDFTERIKFSFRKPRKR